MPFRDPAVPWEEPPGSAHVGAATPLITLRNLRKRYGGVVALDDVSLDLRRGEVHAIVGENGAGKSTLMKVLAGAVTADAGTIEIDGEEVSFSSAARARERRIGIVYQELSLLPDRSVLANLFVNREPTRWGLVSRVAMVREAAPLLHRIGLDAELDAPVRELPLAERQLVELSRVLLERPQILILDEPNSALTDEETQRLFAILRDLAREGIAIVYVSHRLEEVFEIADVVTVMRNGRWVSTMPRAERTIPALVREMTGGAVDALFPERSRAAAVEGRSLVVRGLSAPGLRGVTFEARPGEVVGLAGLEGSGVTRLLSLLFGDTRPDEGDVVFPDGNGLPSGPTAAARRGIALVPADRRQQGLMLEKSVAENAAQVSVGALGTGSPVVSRARLARVATRQIEALAIKAPSPWAPVTGLSGGNQQKVVIGKWLEAAPGVVLLDDPARGVDVGAKAEIFTIMRRLAAEGRVVLFRSTELSELVGVSDRILVFYRGSVTTECDPAAIDSPGLLHAINTGLPPDGGPTRGPDR